MQQSKISLSYLEKVIPFIGLILLVIIISILNSAFWNHPIYLTY